MEHMGITRLGEVEDIANAARFLCSQESSYMTGECLFVAGKPSPRL
jgi:NAD(P)-dependent dehydrogenase (short-subunit alcohol dehydrogenase family)